MSFKTINRYIYINGTPLFHFLMIQYKSVILIDDDEDYLFLSKRSLEKLQIFEKVDVLTSALAGLDFIAANYNIPPSDDRKTVIFIDNHMPGMDGFAFLERLTNVTGIVPENFLVYMTSSFTNDVDKDRLIKYHIQGFVNKPLSLDKLRAMFIDYAT